MASTSDTTTTTAVLPPSPPSITPTTATATTIATTTASTTHSTTTSTSSVSASSSSISPSSPTATTTTPAASTTAALTTTSSSKDIVTQTSTLFVSASRNVASPTSTADSGSSGKPFFQNTPAVVGVFTAIGLVGLAVIFLLARNFHRRRQQEAFDRELQEATRQAAATSAAPFFEDDDDDPYKRTGGNYGPPSGYGSTADRQYSDASHGTYGQPPMSDSYGMREIGHSVGPGEIFGSATTDPYSAGAAGIGVARARSMRADVHSVGGPNGLHQQYVRQPDFGAALADGNKPYAAFVAANHGNLTGSAADPYAPATPSKGPDPLDTAGLGPHMGGAGVATRSQPQAPYGQQQQRAAYHQTQNPNQYYATGVAPSTYIQSHENRYSTVNEDMEDAYGGVADGMAVGGAEPSLPNPFEREHESSDGHGHGRGRADGKDDGMDVASVHSQDEEPRRVLKVANQ